MVLLKHVRSCYSSAQNPHVVPMSYLKHFAWPARSGSLRPLCHPPTLLPSPFPVASNPLLSLNTPALGLFYTKRFLHGNSSQRDSHSALLLISDANLVTLFQIANSTPTPSTPYSSLTRLFSIALTPTVTPQIFYLFIIDGLLPPSSHTGMQTLQRHGVLSVLSTDVSSALTVVPGTHETHKLNEWKNEWASEGIPSHLDTLVWKLPKMILLNFLHFS